MKDLALPNFPLLADNLIGRCSLTSEEILAHGTK